MRHALVHAPDHNQSRRSGGQCQIAEGGEAEGERYWHASEDGCRNDADEKMSRLRLPRPCRSG